jgi:hypothetical protein
MGILGIYPASGYQLNPDDLHLDCPSCGTEKMMTREFLERVGWIPPCRCGDTYRVHDPLTPE